MRRWSVIALVFALLAAVPVWAQRRGGGSGFAGRSAGGFHGSVFRGAPGFRGGRVAPGFRGPHFSPYRFSHGRFFYGGYPWVYPYGTYPYLDSDYADYQYPAMTGPSQGYDTPASYIGPAQVQQDQIDRLENEVDRLREERESRSQPPSRPEPQTATVLVFQNKHSEEVRNYAIVGQTLWVFTELKARKIPLSDLDLDSTTKANEDRGIDFRLPE